MSLKEEVLETASEAWDGQESAKDLAQRLYQPAHSENVTFRTFYDYCKVAVARVRDASDGGADTVDTRSPREVAIDAAMSAWDGEESAKELSIRLFEDYGSSVSPRTFYDWCKIAVSEARGETTIHSNEDDDEVPPVEEAVGVVLKWDGARYKEDGDNYVFYPKTQSTFAISKDVIREMKRAYSNKPLGLGWTINQICRHWRIGRREFVFIKREMGWTHDQDEFTREEHLSLSTEQLLEDREQRSRWFLEQEHKHKQEMEMQRLADIGKSFEERTMVAMQAWQDLQDEREEDDPPRRRPEPRGDRGDWTAVQVITDWHLGKPSNVNMPALGPSIELMDEAAEECDRLLLVFNGDYFHVDNVTNRTTALTPQDTANPDPFFMLRRGYRLGFQLVEAALARFSEVVVRVVSGNHDEMAGKHLLIHLHTIFPEIVRLDPKPLQAEVVGEHLFLFEHGDGGRGKPERMLLYSFDEYRPLWGQTRNTFIWTGHLHHEVVKAVGCTKHFQLPSPSGSDRWHKKNMYGSMRELQVQVFDGKQHRTTFMRKVEVVEEEPYS